MKLWPQVKAWFTLHRFAGGLTPRHWTILLVVPALLLGLLVVAFHDPVGHLSSVSAAVVNQDEPVTVDGQTMPLGRELAASLVNDDDPNYDWILTNADDAADGLADGSYKVVVTIPQDFSQRATSIGDSDPLDAQAAKIQIRSADDVPLLDAAVGRVLADAARRSLGTTITENYLDNVYDGFNTMHDKLSDAADGASTLAEGSDDLVDGTGQLRSGSASLAKGAKKLNTGAQTLAKGTKDLASGASELSSGLSTLKSSTASLPSQTKALASGAGQVADGTQEIQDTVKPATSTIIKAIEKSPDAHDVADSLSSAAADCSGTASFCDALSELASRAQSDADEIENAKATAKTKAQQVQDDVSDLNEGAHQVADGASELASASATLVSAISDAADGGQQVATGAKKVNSGAQQLASGTAELSQGASDLHAGATKVDDGANQLSTGAHTLADGLNSAVKQVPTYTDDERDHLKAIVAAPISTEVVGSDGYTNSALALFTVLALWAAALLAFVMLPAMPRDVRVSHRPTWLLALNGSLPGAGIGAGQAVAAAATLALILALPPTGFLLVLIAGVLTCAAFMVLNRALAAGWAHWGRTVSIAVLALTLATAVTSAQPSLLQAIAPYLPTTAALSLLRNAIAGNAHGTLTGTLIVLGWLVLGYVVTIIQTDKHRIVRIGDLRSQPPPPWPYLAPGGMT